MSPVKNRPVLLKHWYVNIANTVCVLRWIIYCHNDLRTLIYWYVSYISCVMYTNDHIDSSGWDRNMPSGLLYKNGLNLTAWMNNHISSKVWHEITYPFPKFNGATVEVWEWKSNFMPHFIMGVIIHPWYSKRASRHLSMLHAHLW